MKKMLTGRCSIITSKRQCDNYAPSIFEDLINFTLYILEKMKMYAYVGRKMPVCIM